MNPIHELLDAAGVPWRDTLATLAARFGVRRHPAYEWDVVFIELPTPFAPGLLWPLSVQMWGAAPLSMPAPTLSASAHWGNDARQNLERVVQHFGSLLGEPTKEDVSNALTRAWRFQRAMVTARVWPSDMQRRPLTNPAHQREPRLIASCHVSIDPGHRQELSVEELDWLRSFRSLAALDVAGVSESHAVDRPVHPAAPEFVRLPTPEATPAFGQLGMSADRAALILFTRHLWVVPRARIEALEVARLLPAKGGGGSDAYLVCRSPDDPKRRVRVPVQSGTRPDELNDLAARLSDATGIPHRLLPYEHDA